MGPFQYPQLISKLAPHRVTCISVGGGHMVPLTADGLCFAWGEIIMASAVVSYWKKMFGNLERLMIGATTELHVCHPCGRLLR